MPALAQNFTLPVGQATQINFVVVPAVGDTLLGSNIFWSAFATLQVLPQTPAVIRKMLDYGIQVDDPVAQTFHVTLTAADTQLLTPGNYAHETVIIDGEGNPTWTTEGVMTLTATATTDFSIPTGPPGQQVISLLLDDTTLEHIFTPTVVP
jgi:hypothetical protein